MKITALLLAFYMLVGGLIPRTDFSQLLRLGNLKSHYQEHKVEAIDNNETLSFLEFCYIHFIDNTQHDGDSHEEEHQQLPFQTINSLVLNIVALNVLSFDNTPISIIPSNFYACPFHLKGFSTPSIEPPSC